MNDYEFIANLKGDQGADATEIPGASLGNPIMITDDMDVDNLDPGIYRLASSSQASDLLGLPFLALGTLEVKMSTFSQTMRTFTRQSSDTSPVMLLIQPQDMDGVWGEWETIYDSRTPNIGGQGVSRIIASKDAEHPLEDGDLLVLIDTPSYFTDFTDQPIGGPPEGWTQRWADSAHTIEYDPESPNGIVLAHPGFNPIAYRGLSWDRLDGEDQQDRVKEIVYKWRGSGLAQPRAVSNGAGAEGSETGYFGGVHSAVDASMVGSIQDGSDVYATSHEGDTDPEEGEWWATRLRIEPGNRAAIRSWQWGTQEPSQWAAEIVVTSSLPSGWIGLLTRGGGWTQYDWVGVAFDGGRAPVGA